LSPNSNNADKKGDTMILKVFSIRDAKAEVYNTPFYKPEFGEAERDFRTAVNDEKTLFNRYPEDFDLYYLGEYNDKDGKVNWEDTPKHMLKAVDVRQPTDADRQMKLDAVQ
jgi:hypothetical protein